MADNITAPAVGAVLATDEIGGVHWPFSRLAFGPDGTSVRVADADGARLPVTIGGLLPGFAAAPTVNIGTMPAITVTGGLTNAELRATPVAVAFTGQTVGITGSVAVTGPLTDAQLRATALPVSGTVGVSGTVAVTGPATNAELRATPLPVSGTVTANAGTGTFAVSAVALPLPTGAATAAAQTTGNASLASIDGKFAALESGRAPVAVQTVATTTRAYSLANAIRVAFTATSTTEAALPVMGATREIRFAANARCWVKWGATGLTAAAPEAASFVIEANAPEVLAIPAGATHYRVVRDSADGSLLMTPVA